MSERVTEFPAPWDTDLLPGEGHRCEECEGRDRLTTWTVKGHAVLTLCSLCMDVDPHVITRRLADR
jgi:hypothetical protein